MEQPMNWFHRQVCRSGRWRRRLEGNLLPWALEGLELGGDVLEIGPGPGVTTDLLRRRTRRLTALEVDAIAAAALRKWPSSGTGLDSAFAQSELRQEPGPARRSFLAC